MTSLASRRLEGLVTRTTARLLDHAQRNSLSVAELARARLPWYEVRSVDPGPGPEPEPEPGPGPGPGPGAGPGPGRTATILIYDEIGGSLGVSASNFAREVGELDVDVIKLRINSPGGYVRDGIAIYNTLLHHPARVVVYVDSLAASAASVIAMAGDEIIMMPGSQMMIHDALALLNGNEAEHVAVATHLGRQSDNIAGFYARRTGDDPEHWRKIMRDELWLFADEAVEIGIADRVQPVRPPGGDVRMERTFDLSTFGYRYTCRQEAPAPRSSRPRRHGAPAFIPSARGPAGRAGDHAAEAAIQRSRALDRREPPGGTARSVCTQWMLRSADRRGDRATEAPPRLAVRRQERDGKAFAVVEGYATTYERGYEMWDVHGPYTEIVSAGAGAQTVLDDPDVVFLVNHRGLAMARTVAGTLDLWSDDVGMANRAWLNPQRQDVRDLVLGIEDGTITEQSFSFLIVDGLWSPDYTEYRIDVFDVDRGDTSAVNYGANPYTSIATRGRELIEDLDKLPDGAARAALDRLNDRMNHGGEARSAVVTPARMPAERDSATDTTVQSTASVEAWLATVDAHRL